MQDQYLNSCTLCYDRALFLMFTDYIVFCENAFRVLIIFPFDQSHLSLIYDEHFIKLLALFGNNFLIIVNPLFKP